jgi:hypothetical protein
VWEREKEGRTGRKLFQGHFHRQVMSVSLATNMAVPSHMKSAMASALMNRPLARSGRGGGGGMRGVDMLQRLHSFLFWKCRSVGPDGEIEESTPVKRLGIHGISSKPFQI